MTSVRAVVRHVKWTIAPGREPNAEPVTVIWRLIARAAGPLLVLTIAASIGFVLVFAWRASTS